MKILIPVFNFGKQGGFRVLSNLANEWISLGHEVAFLSCTDSIAPYFPTAAKVFWISPTGSIKPKNSKARRNKLQRSIHFFLKFYSILKGINTVPFDFDIILANQSLTAFPVYFCKTHARKVYYVQAYEPGHYDLYKGINNALLKQISRKSYSLNLDIIVNSPIFFDYKEIKSAKCVYPGIDWAIFYPKAHSTMEGQIILGCLGRVEPFKGTKDVLEAFTYLRREGINVILRMAFGDKSFERENIEIVIPANDRELGDFYRNIDILIAPGTIELGAVHLPVIEAMACGTPVITTGYYPADINNAWIVPIKSPGSIAETVKHIINNPNLALLKSKLAQKSIKEFNWTLQAKKMLNYFTINNSNNAIDHRKFKNGERLN